MTVPFFIMLREGFEAALVIAILFAYLRKTGRADLLPPMWAGVGAAAALSIAAGVVIHLSVDGLTGEPRLYAFAAISLFAVVVLTWMIFWMRSHASSLSRELRSGMDEAIDTHDNVRFGVVVAAFLAVLREGLEASLFLVAAATSGGGAQVLVGGLLGLAVAMVAGWLVVVGGRRMPMRQFFTVTGVMLVVFAAGLLARSVAYLQTAGVAMVATGNAYDLTRYEHLTTSTETGRFLAAMTGWDPRPSWLQVAVWVLYMAVVTTLFLRRSTTPAAAQAPRPKAPVEGQPAHQQAAQAVAPAAERPASTPSR